MKKKINVIIAIILFALCIVMSLSKIYAGSGKLYVNLTTTDLNGIGYAITDPNNDQSGQAPYIWNIMTYDSKNASAISEAQRNLYCVNADYGQTWFTGEKEDEILEYNLCYDIQAEREAVLSKIVDNENDADEVIKKILDPTGTQYRELLWILDNAYIAGEDTSEYLETVGIFAEEYNGQITYYNKNSNTNYTSGDPLTEADIIAIQRMVIWYFTNGSENEVYDKTGENEDQWLNITLDGTNYDALSNLSQSRNEMAMDVYNYLITQAQKGASQYTAENNYTISSQPVIVNTTGLNQEEGKYKIETEIMATDYIVGPIIIDENNSSKYEITMKVTNESGVEITSSNYTFTDKDGISLGNVTLEDLVGKEFYIKVARDLVQKININIQVKYSVTTKTLWLQGTETDNQITLNAEQPLVEITRNEEIVPIDLIAIPEFTEVTESMGNKAKEYALNNFTSKRHSNEIIKLYDELLRRSNK